MKNFSGEPNDGLLKRLPRWITWIVDGFTIIDAIDLLFLVGRGLVFLAVIVARACFHLFT